MFVSLLVLSLFVNLASAKDLVPGSLPLTQVGAVADLKGCEVHVLANPWTAGNTVKVLIGQARAQQICSDAKGDLAIAEAKAQAIKDASAAEAGLVNTAGIAIMTGDSVSYDHVLNADGSMTTHLAAGPAGTVHELAAVAAALDPRLDYGQYGPYAADPNLVGLARLSGIPLGAPVMGTQAATAPCGTAEQCEAKVKALQSALAKQ